MLSRLTPDTRRMAIMVLLMTLMMGAVLSGVATLTERGIGRGFLAAWWTAFAGTYVIVLPLVAVISPLARRWAVAIDKRLFAANE